MSGGQCDAYTLLMWFLCFKRGTTQVQLLQVDYGASAANQLEKRCTIGRDIIEMLVYNLQVLRITPLLFRVRLVGGFVIIDGTRPSLAP